MSIVVRPLRSEDIGTSGRIHREVLDTEFLARCGERFLRCYHRAWIASEDGVALAAVDDKREVVGVLLGAVRPASHYRAMVRSHGVALALFIVLQAVTRPRFAKELLATRFLRYVRGLFRIIGSSFSRRALRASRQPTSQNAPRSPNRSSDTAEPRSSVQVGEVTHIMVRRDLQGRGVGRALLRDFQRAAQVSGVDELVLVTPPDLAGSGLYEHLGWRRTRQLTSRSGEDFVEYRLTLRPESVTS